MKGRFLTVAAMAILGLMWSATTAKAGTITYYADIFAGCDYTGGNCTGPGTTATTTAPSGTTMVSIGAQNAVYVPGFNPALGTLTDVTVTLDSQIEATLKVVNPNNTSIGAYKGTIAVPVDITGNGPVSSESVDTAAGFGSLIDGLNNITHDILGSANSSGNETTIAANTTAYFYYSPNAQPGATNTQIKNTATGTSTTGGNYTNSNTQDFGADAHFISSNLLSFTSDTSGTSVGASFSGASGETAGPNGTAGGLLTVTYEYTPTPTPEPATFLLLGTALVGLAVGLKRRQHKA